MLMSINGLNVKSPVSARYWSELKDLRHSVPGTV